nr:hypothetical protein [Tanacetum cinerariifolium]
RGLMEMGEKMAEKAGESRWQGKAGKMVEQCTCTVKNKQENDKIGTKSDKNRKRGEAENSQK